MLNTQLRETPKHWVENTEVGILWSQLVTLSSMNHTLWFQRKWDNVLSQNISSCLTMDKERVAGASTLNTADTNSLKSSSVFCLLMQQKPGSR